MNTISLIILWCWPVFSLVWSLFDEIECLAIICCTALYKTISPVSLAGECHSEVMTQ